MILFKMNVLLHAAAAGRARREGRRGTYGVTGERLVLCRHILIIRLTHSSWYICELIIAIFYKMLSIEQIELNINSIFLIINLTC